MGAPVPELTPIGVQLSPSPPVRSDLYRRLLWLAVFRVAAITVLVGTTAVLAFKNDEPLGGQVSAQLSALAIGTNVLQIAVAVLLRFRKRLQLLAVIQIVGDVLFATGLVWLTGGAESLFSFLYLLAVVNGSILLSARGAWLAAALSGVADLSLVLGLQYRVLPAPHTGTGELSSTALIQALFVNVAAFSLTAVLSTYVARQLDRAGARATAAESSLTDLSVLHDSIVRSIASGIVTADPIDRITFLNRAGEDIVGKAGAELRGTSLPLLFPVLTRALAEARVTGVPRRLDGTWVDARGQARYLGFTVTPLQGAEGRRLGTATVFQDLTRYRELESRAMRSERLAAVGKLAAGLAHELRNPLASMSGSVELLAAARAQSPEDKRLFDIVTREAERLNRLVSDFLSFARPPAPQIQPVDLPEIVGEVLQVFAADPQGAHVERGADLQPAVAMADPAQLKQVLWNLVLNAAQATPPGGALLVTTGVTEEPGRVFVRVTDTGSGIQPEDMARLFDPFFTTKERGTGLGLATVHRVVDAHGGHVEVASEPGRGSAFTVILPAAQAVAAEVA